MEHAIHAMELAAGIVLFPLGIAFLAGWRGGMSTDAWWYIPRLIGAADVAFSVVILVSAFGGSAPWALWTRLAAVATGMALVLTWLVLAFRRRSRDDFWETEQDRPAGRGAAHSEAARRRAARSASISAR